MRIVVLGAGAIGSIYAAKLSTKHEVTVLARGAHADAINRAGLRLIGLEPATCAVKAVTSTADLPDSDLFLLTTKVNDNASVASGLADRVRNACTVLCVQNGLGGEEIVKRALGSRALVLRAVTHFGGMFVEPGVVDFKVKGYTLVERAAGSEELAALLTDCGLAARLSESITHDVWRKLLFNCVINPVTAIISSDVGTIADPRLDAIKRPIIADGVTFDMDFMTALEEIFGRSRNIASMRQDLMRGKPTEIDFMNGAVVDLGRRFGLECPVNAAVVALVKALERSAAHRTA
jgi:2-dehydropantoate 2-reductase